MFSAPYLVKSENDRLIEFATKTTLSPANQRTIPSKQEFIIHYGLELCRT